MLHRRRPTRFEPPPPKSEPGRRTAGEGRATETEGSVYHILYSLQTGSGISLDNMPDPLYSRLVSGDELRDHLARIGKRGGKKNTPAQDAARRRNFLMALAKRWPRSVTVKQKLALLKEEEENGRG